MGTQLNIKDVETIELARTLARRSGKSVTATIRDALQAAASTDRKQMSVRAEQLLADLRRIPVESPRELVAKTSRELINEVHEEDWQDQYGPDTWS